MPLRVLCDAPAPVSPAVEGTVLREPASRTEALKAGNRWALHGNRSHALAVPVTFHLATVNHASGWI